MAKKVKPRRRLTKTEILDEIANEAESTKDKAMKMLNSLTKDLMSAISNIIKTSE